MAVLFREKRVIDGVEFDDLVIYRSSKFPITKEDEIRANELDRYLKKFFQKLIKKVKKRGLLENKNKPGVLELWYFVGMELKIIDNSRILNPSDKKYIWAALWQYAGELAPGSKKTRAGTHRDHFLYCYKLGRYEKEFVFSAGTWRNWSEFFDSPITSNNAVIEWFGSKMAEIKKLNKKNWMRVLNKLIRNEFSNVDMTFIPVDIIQNKLDRIYKTFIEDIKYKD
jgi:hypothetical protein